MSLFLLYKVVRDTLQVLSFDPKVSSQQADPHVGSATDFTPDVLPLMGQGLECTNLRPPEAECASPPGLDRAFTRPMC